MDGHDCSFSCVCQFTFDGFRLQEYTYTTGGSMAPLPFCSGAFFQLAVEGGGGLEGSANLCYIFILTVNGSSRIPEMHPFYVKQKSLKKGSECQSIFLMYGMFFINALQASTRLVIFVQSLLFWCSRRGRKLNVIFTASRQRRPSNNNDCFNTVTVGK